MTVGPERVAERSATSGEPDGSIERAEFRGPPGGRVFSYLHLPASAPRGAVVVCSPLHGEFIRNYRREVLLARDLAAAGQAVLRFHYRGSGNSDGDGRDLTFDSMREDALASIERLRAEVPEGPVTIVGTRWGSLIAASAASLHPEAALVLWEPLATASRFFADAFMSRRVREVRRGVGRPSTDQELQDRLAAGEGVDVVAHRLEPALYRSSVERTLEAELGAVPRRILAAQIGPTASVRPELAKLAQRWEGAGFQVDAIGLKGEETWWLVEERYDNPSERPVSLELIEITSSWITSTAEARA
jgi:pimeloyl-ACP methyl ester carboxylesterase